MRTVAALLLAAIVSAPVACGPIQIGSSRERDDPSAGAPGAGSGGRGPVGQSGTGGMAGGRADGGGHGGRSSIFPPAGAGRAAAGAGPVTATAGAGNGGSAGQAAGAAGTPDTEGGGQGGATGCDERVTVAGRVTSPSGAPLPGVTITVSGDESATTLTDASGYYAVGGRCPGAYTVTPSSDGLQFCRPEAAFAHLDRDTTQDFTGSLEGCDPTPIERRLLVLIYDPNVDSHEGKPRRLTAARGWEDPTPLVWTFLSMLEDVSNGHVRYEATVRSIAAFPPGLDGFRYGAADYAECLRDSTLCHESEFVDYDSIVAEEGLCDALESGDADEVWLLGGPHFGFTALRTYMSCRRLVDLVGFDYAEGLSGLFGGFQARSEAAFSQIFGSAQPAPLEEFQQAATEASGNVSGCGLTGASPNAVPDHPFDSPDPVASYCDAYYQYPLIEDVATLAQPVTCADWECSELGYRRYWLRHLPRARGLDADGWLADWWRYVLDPDERHGRSELSCSPSYTSGWCENVIDGHYGECNVGEWATPKRSTGWVEFHWFAPRSVQHIEIYDRACNERVLRGHVEFSDGSSPIEFGPLGADGMTPEVIDFEPKTLSGLSVFIDRSNGMNPGFGEIVVN